jgi:hypothetical protein
MPNAQYFYARIALEGKQTLLPTTVQPMLSNSPCCNEMRAELWSRQPIAQCVVVHPGLLSLFAELTAHCP